MRLLADESCDFAIVRGLRSSGYDVTSIAESSSGASDEQVISLARLERRLLITEDKDFGQLVFSAARENSGDATQCCMHTPCTVMHRWHVVHDLCTGLAAFDEQEDSLGNEDRLDEASDPVAFALRVPRADPPGTVYRYNSLTAYVAGLVVEKAVNQRLADFARSYCSARLGSIDGKALLAKELQ